MFKYENATRPLASSRPEKSGVLTFAEKCSSVASRKLPAIVAHLCWVFQTVYDVHFP